MNKSELAEVIRGVGDYSKAEADRIVERLFDTIIDSVSKGEQVSVAGFGIFESRERKARTGRNPRTGESISIPASKSPKFRPAKMFKDAVK